MNRIVNDKSKYNCKNKCIRQTKIKVKQNKIPKQTTIG